MIIVTTTRASGTSVQVVFSSQARRNGDYPDHDMRCDQADFGIDCLPISQFKFP